MIKFSANLGFLWPELSLPERIIAASRAGFDAVECHFPYDTPSDEINSALTDTGLSMLCLNTVLGVNGADDFGLAARPDRIDEARAAIHQAIDYAVEIDCQAINVVPGKTKRANGCEQTFQSNLRHACDLAAEHGKRVMIEPINTRAAPGFHLTTVEQAIETVSAVSKDNLKIMFDCFHIQVMQGDLLNHLKTCLPMLGHVQISAVHDRGEPDTGEINYPYLLSELDQLGWNGYIGAEYHPRVSTNEGLSWLKHYQ